MCNFFSSIWTRDGRLLWHWATDHHSQLMQIHGLSEDREAHFVRVELLPPSEADKIADAANWQFVLDQERRPGWFDEEAESACQQAMRKFIQSHIITGERHTLVDGPWVLAGDAKVNQIIAGRIALIAGSATIQNAGSATIQDAGSATIKYAGSATIQNAGSATIKYAGSATIQNAGSATIQDAGSATIQNAGSATIQYAGSATIAGIKHRRGSPITETTSAQA